MSKNIIDSVWWQIIVILLGLVGSVGAAYVNTKVENLDNNAKIAIMNNKEVILVELRDFRSEMEKTISSIDRKVDRNIVYLEVINKRLDKTKE